MDTRKTAADFMKLAEELGEECQICFDAAEVQVFWNGLEFTTDPKGLAAVLSALAILAPCFTSK